ncbi:MAG: tetratricopeptide repeat protein [Verrucomicrobia bacterium]|nr:tetratricopeptide repeat protein [Verrucomicrobiota bacterium]
MKKRRSASRHESNDGKERPGQAPLSKTSPARISVVRKVVFASIAVLLAVGMLEALLALVGVESETYIKDPYVGFASESPLFVEQRVDGRTVMATARERLSLFNPQQFSRKKTPGTFRIFSVGGSTTFGRPYADATSFSGWLREFLPAGAPARKWEVINAGGVSYASYRVAHLMEELIQYEPDLFVIYSGHNEFLEHRLYTKVIEAPKISHRLRRTIGRLRTATLVGRFLEKAIGGRPQPGSESPTLLSGEVDAQLDHTVGPSSYHRDEESKKQILDHYAFNVNRMIDIAASVGARVLLITPASNLRACSPFKSEHREGLDQQSIHSWQNLLGRAHQALRRDAPQEALSFLDQALAVDAAPAHLHFLRAQVLDRLGRFDEAKASYLRARDEDVCPLRAPEPVLAILRDIAHQTHTPLIDFQSFLDHRSENGIPGATEFLDHVHPSMESHRLLALEIIAALGREGVVGAGIPDETAIRQVTRKVMDSVDPHEQAVGMMNLCKVLGWAGKRDEAYRAGLEAARLEPGSAEVQYETGLAARMLNQNQEAEGFLRKAIGLNPKHAEAHCALGVILEDQGRLQEALTHYESALAHGRIEQRERDVRNLESVKTKLGAAGAKP